MDEANFDFNVGVNSGWSNTVSFPYGNPGLITNEPIHVKNNSSVVEKKNKKDLLGQVFTPETLAKFMNSLFLPYLKSNHRVLDPCIGPNTFFKHLDLGKVNPFLVGIELDKSLITKETQQFYSKKKRKLLIDSFFNLSLKEKFDFAVLNPPYVRQELMMEGQNSKEIATDCLADFTKLIPAKSNLYVYFLLKSIFHLKENGKMVAVIFDSWLYSEFGTYLKEIMFKFGVIESVYHIKKNAFPDADVGATILEFKKTKNSVNHKINIYSVNSLEDFNSKGKLIPLKKLSISDFNSYRFNEETAIDFKSNFFIPVKSISSQPIQRGVSCIVNKHFIHGEKQFKESIPFIKDVTKINSYTFKDRPAFLLAINGSVSSKTKLHVEKVKKEILGEKEKFKALKKKIKTEDHWYKVQLKKPGNIIFNYYLRKNIDFILNNEMYYSSDNFYIINIDKELLANFAILNSSFTKLSVLRNSRNQGNGLRKVQLYEFKEVQMIDLAMLSKTAIKSLAVLANKLKTTNRLKSTKELLISEIDKLLLEEYNTRFKTKLSLSQLKEELQQFYSN